jgi:hypothetical protein
MQVLRNARTLSRLGLLWFALALSAAIASPLIKPLSIELICSGSGVTKVMAASDDGTSPAVASTLDCPMCATLGAPPLSVCPAAATHDALLHALQGVAAAHVAARSAAPLPARGPPDCS